MSLGGGDQLARGATKAQFTTPNVPDEKWKDAFGDDNGFEERMRKKALAEGVSEEQYDKMKEQAEKLALDHVREQTQLEKQARLEADKKIKFRAIQDRIIVERVEAEEKAGQFYLPDETKEKPYEGVVIAVGPGRYTTAGEFIPVSVQVGELVVFGKFSGAEIKIGSRQLLVLREEDIFVVKEETND